jgi:hypothetical protein
VGSGTRPVQTKLLLLKINQKYVLACTYQTLKKDFSYNKSTVHKSYIVLVIKNNMYKLIIISPPLPRASKKGSQHTLISLKKKPCKIVKEKTTLRIIYYPSRVKTIYNFVIKRVFSPYRRSSAVGRKLQGDSSIDFIQHFLLLRREYIGK